MKPTAQQLADQLYLQTQLNNLVRPDWLIAGLPWHRAMMVEAVEMLEHYGYKWWKAQEADMPQVHLELVDIWHFMLSHFLARNGGDPVATALCINNWLDSPENSVFVGYAPVDLSVLPAPKLMDTFVALTAGGIVSITAFTHLMSRLGLSWDELNRTYLAKNVLNIFRQKHGYKDGSYVKTWHGKEDNVVLHALLLGRPNATADQLFDKLERIYSELEGTTA